MTFSVDPKIFETFPGVAIGVVSISDMVNSSNVEEITKLLQDEEAKQRQALNGVELGALLEVSAWRQIYKQFGSDPHDFRSSIESLLRRARGGKPLPLINPLVDLYNYLSLKYHLPAGAEDLDKVVGDISLMFADGSEKGIALGFDTEEAPDPGEIIYKDSKGFICRKWNWREADRTKIDPTTKRAVLVLEQALALQGESLKAALQAALSEAKALLEAHLHARCAIMVLDEKNVSCSL